MSIVVVPEPAVKVAFGLKRTRRILDKASPLLRDDLDQIFDTEQKKRAAEEARADFE